MILHLLCIYIAVNMTEVVIKILQGGSIRHLFVANFLQCVSAYENRLKICESYKRKKWALLRRGAYNNVGLIS